MPQELRIPNKIDLAAFISREAHDLKAPFNRSLGFIKLVLEGFDGPISEQAENDLTVAYQNAQYTLMMMNALVDVARLKRCEIDPLLESHSLSTIFQKTISEWTHKYHKKNTVEISYSTPEVKIRADEILIRRSFAHWISYVNEFVQESASIFIIVKEQPHCCLITIRSTGTKHQEPPQCDLTLFSFVARGLIDLNQGELIKLEEDEQGALVQISLPKAM